jgi:hypothetical protein
VAFERIGYFTPASKRIKGITTKEKILAERTNPDGTRTLLKIRILGSGAYGLPITADLDYYRAFLKLLDTLVDHGGSLPEPIAIPTRTFIRTAGKQVSAREFRAVQDWIRRSNATAIQGFYYDAVRGDYIEIGGEPLFPRYVIRGQQLPTGEYATTHAVWLASWFRSNYLHHHVRPLDLAFHLRLRKPIAKALYPLLDLGWYATGGQPYTKSYPELCQEFLLHDSRYLSRIKQQLDPAHQELVQERFLAHWEYRPAAKGSTWVITYHPGPKFFEDQQARAARQQVATRSGPAPRPRPVASPAPSEPWAALLAEILAVCGDRQHQAAYQQVLRDYPETLIRLALAETRQAQHEGRIRKTRGAYFLDTLKRLVALRTPSLLSQAETTATVPPPVTSAPVRTVSHDAMQERRALEAARQHTHARVNAVLAAFTPAERQAFEARATAQVTLQPTELGYGIMLQCAREDLVQQEHLGFDRWARLVAQLQAHDATAAADAVLAACQLEALYEETLVVSVPTADAHAHLITRYLDTLAALASTPTHRMQLQVLVR